MAMLSRATLQPRTSRREPGSAGAAPNSRLSANTKVMAATANSGGLRLSPIWLPRMSPSGTPITPASSSAARKRGLKGGRKRRSINTAASSVTPSHGNQDADGLELDHATARSLTLARSPFGTMMVSGMASRM